MERDLNDAYFFTHVVELGSLSAAAREAGLPVSTVSRRITRLELRLGVTLLVRTTRRLGLTDAGRVYHDYARRAIAELEVGERMVHDFGGQPKGHVRITMPQGIAHMMWPAIAEFLARFPEVTVDLDAGERRVDLVDERYDLAVRTGALTDSMLVARKLLDIPHQLFATPEYLSRNGTPRTIKELERHDCVVVGRGTKPTTWTLHQGNTSVHIVVRSRIRVSEMSLAWQATLSGYGVGKLPTAMVGDDVRAGRLRRVLSTVDGGPAPLWLIYPAVRAVPGAVRALADHLADRMPKLHADRRRTE